METFDTYSLQFSYGSVHIYNVSQCLGIPKNSTLFKLLIIPTYSLNILKDDTNLLLGSRSA